MKKLIIIGGSGFGKEVIWLVQDLKQYDILGILDDRLEKDSTFFNYPILGKVEDAEKYKDCCFAIAIGSPRVRELIYKKLQALGIINFPNLIHPSVIHSSSVSMGKGNIICAGTILTTDIVLGDFNIINLSCTVGHDTQILNFCTVAPLSAISGNVTLNNLVEIGTGANIRQGLTIGQGSMLGMGGVLTKSIELENQIFVGNPASFLKQI